ncbi:four helix bundle protein [Pleurocapsa sp. PCC 7319]|uniref:four helix bundle protein n=1 Tax=Pleurocapsa sp. PCC 7319 TaxID=118161 RepID=UPI000374D9CC|nr:four helix bundle protein [Pleurocapsa sp. PCC 7319]
MNNNNITIQQRTKLFASRVIKAYSEINERNHFNSACAILSKQFLRSGTSIGANISEGVYAQSDKDFLSKYLIALKEASETKYWIELMLENDLVPKNKFSDMLEEIEVIIKILVAITKKLKQK